MSTGIELTEKNWYFRRSMVIGRIAESLIEQLFLSQGYDVFRYGVENTVPGILSLLGDQRSKVSRNIRKMPDLIVHKDGKAFFIEVKFRREGEFEPKEPIEEYPFESVFFIIVTKNAFKCISVEELRRGLRPDENPYYLLANRKEFAFNKEVLEKFRSFSSNIYNGL